MFITEEQLVERLKSPRNLANRFKSGSENATNDSWRPTAAPEKEEGGTKTEESKCLVSLPAISRGITHKEIKRPGNCRPWLSKQERNSIALTAAQGGIKQKDIAIAYGVKDSTVSDIVNGTRRIEGGPRSVDDEKVQAALDKVRERAIDKLMSSLDQITDDKVSGLGAKDASIVACNMSKVVKDTMPQEKAGPQQINLVVYAPELRNEKTFEVVEI